MKKLAALLVALAFAFAAPAAAASQSAVRAANELHELGLFHGVGLNYDGTPDYALDRAPTRAEAVTMIVRLLGREDAARLYNVPSPFTDVPQWAEPYVSFAYAARLTGGFSPTYFGSDYAVTAAEYLTFLLRALGYEEGTDFVWDDPWVLAATVGLTTGYYRPEHNPAQFTRGDAAILSYNALSCSMKDHSQTLRAQMHDNTDETLGAY